LIFFWWHGWGLNPQHLILVLSNVPLTTWLWAVMGSGQKFFTLVGSGQPFMVGFEFGKFPLKRSNFQFFSLRVKKYIFGLGRKVPVSKARRASYLLRVKNKLGSGQGPSLTMARLQPVAITIKHSIDPSLMVQHLTGRKKI